ncbi:hypothetical protein A0O34_07125 [Chryseobacterium glaciei]|uniref:Thioredoxin domain-containing protein n=1 Tax=Chryseobacterium glaciei TaxID=1685010 RepID=A0A172XTL8_9FLAO|nr:hypothetical protein [Chryseobacterium glaciei]ANF50301.1 hypothetical protein A0O34_07125 [Chryseobacterium glaciei]
MKTKYIYILILFANFSLSTLAQEIKPLKIGDTIPSIALKEMLFYTKPSANLRDFVGKKAIIIDFFETYCAPCLAAIPHLDTTQRRYEKDLQVIMATGQDRKIITDLFQAERFKQHKMPIVINTRRILYKYFPFNIIPFQAWIDKNGVVKAMVSGSQFMKDKYLKDLISGERLNLPTASNVPASEAIPTDPLVYNNFNPKIFLNYSYVSKYDDQIKSGRIQASKDELTGLFRIKLQNMGFVDHFWTAHFGLDDSVKYNRSVTVVRDDTKPFASKPDVINHANSFCYDGYAFNRDVALKVMRNTLDAAFAVKSYSERRSVKCLVIKELGEHKSYQLKTDKRNGLYKEKGYYILDNSSFRALEVYLNVASDDYLVLNEVPYKGKVNFKFRWLPNDIEQMNEDLKHYDLQMVEEERMETVLVLKDN